MVGRGLCGGLKGNERLGWGLGGSKETKEWEGGGGKLLQLFMIQR